MKDSADLQVTGALTWTGTLKFFMCGPIATGTCDGTTNIGTQMGPTQNVPKQLVRLSTLPGPPLRQRVDFAGARSSIDEAGSP